MQSEMEWSAPIEPASSGRPYRWVRWLSCRNAWLATIVWAWAASSATPEWPVERLRPGPGSYSSNSAIEAAEQVVVRDLESWSATWGRVHGRSRLVPPLPAVDFEHEMMVIVALGRQRSGGFVVRIERAYREGPTLVIVLHEERPGPGCVVPTAMTYPVDLARLAWDAGPVSFQSEVVTSGCQ